MESFDDNEDLENDIKPETGPPLLSSVVGDEGNSLAFLVCQANEYDERLANRSLSTLM